MSASIKVLLYTHKTYSDGSHPIVIQVIVNRKAIKKTVGRCKPDQWNESTCRVRARKHPNYALINKKISDEFNRIENEILSDDQITRKGVKNVVTDVKPEEVKEIMLIEALTQRRDLYFETLKVSAYKHYGTLVNELEAYLVKDIEVKSIDTDWLDLYVSHLANRKVLPNKINTIAKKLKAISSIIKISRKKNPKILNPFDDYQIKKQKVLKIKLSVEDLEIFKAYPLISNHQEMCRDIFLFQIYFRGMRIGDILELKKEWIIKGRIKFSDDKTEKKFDIKLIPQAKEIIEKYKDYESERIFPLLKWQDQEHLSVPENTFKRKKAIESCTSMVNKVISMIGRESTIKKKVSTHTARHTFIKIASDTIQNTRITMGLSGHSSLKVHQNYIEDLNQEDELDDAVDGLVF